MKTLLVIFLFFVSSSVFSQNQSIFSLKQPPHHADMFKRSFQDRLNSFLINCIVNDVNHSDLPSFAFEYNYPLVYQPEEVRTRNTWLVNLNQVLFLTSSALDYLDTPRGSFKYFFNRPGAPTYLEFNKANEFSYTYNPYNATGPGDAIISGLINTLIGPKRNKYRETSFFISD